MNMGDGSTQRAALTARYIPHKTLIRRRQDVRVARRSYRDRSRRGRQRV